MSDVTVIKIGGSTLGSHDTSLDDIATLHAEGRKIVIVHGGGATISEWLDIHGIESRFVHGLRATDEAALDVVVAVLGGVVNKHLVAELESRGARAVGLSGADGGIIRAKQYDPELGFVGEVAHVEPTSLRNLVEGGAIAVLAPLAIEGDATNAAAQLLNVNADTAAGAVAAALRAAHLVYLTDVPGVLDSEGGLIATLNAEEAEQLVEQEAATGGMIPKLKSAIGAAASGVETLIADGRQEGTLLTLLSGAEAGIATRIAG